MNRIACGIAVGVLAVGGLAAWGWYALGRDELRPQPEVSSSEPLVRAPIVVREGPLPKEAGLRLEQFEKALAKAHEALVTEFQDAEGFGMDRLPVVRKHTLELQGTPPQHTWSTEQLEKDHGVDRQPLERLHLFSAVGFSKTTSSDTHESQGLMYSRRWNVVALDLVGLATHDEPVAYVSKQLPRMKELKNSPTRPLDVFEKVALERLHAGDDLFVRRAGTDVRVLGALRAADQCLRCHGGSRGDLLGAFSYTLRVSVGTPVHFAPKK